jgi:predicted DNA-binding transcriptional regulator AlpA
MTKTSYISVEEVSKLLMVDRGTIKEWVKDGKFPPPNRLNERGCIWSYAVIENWIAQQQQTQDFINNNDIDLI